MTSFFSPPSELMAAASTVQPIVGTTESILESELSDDSASMMVTATETTSNLTAVSTLDIDPEKLVFHLGQSPSKSDSFAVRSPTSSTDNSMVTASPSGLPSTSTTSNQSKDSPSLFDDYIRTASSDNTPRRFHFESKTSEVSSTNQLQSADSKALSTATLPSGFRAHSRRPTPHIPSLGPDITIRPIITRNPKPSPHENPNTKKTNQQKHNVSDNDVSKLMSGYNRLTKEVATLKNQLAHSQSTVNEIFDSFSSEVAKLNARLEFIEQKVAKDQNGENLSIQNNLSSNFKSLSLTKQDEEMLESD